MMQTAHYFIAIPLPKSLQRYLSNWQEELKEKLNYKQWPHSQDLHITLKFLGPVDDNKIGPLHHRLQKTTNTQPFTIEVGSIGTFGKADMPRVLWAGVNKTQNLANLQQQIERLLLNMGYEKETRPYRPHITLAKKWYGDAAGALLGNIKTNYSTQWEMVVERIVLYRIHPLSNPKYEPVYTYRLQGGE